MQETSRMRHKPATLAVRGTSEQILTIVRPVATPIGVDKVW